ncbi:hypothetical protein ACS0PU_000278 [Formica fusca]
MDMSNKVRQRHEYGTCLCFSVMGRRKLRISICAISSPETGDASSIMSERRKYSAISGAKNFENASPSRQDKNPIASTISSNSINVVKNYMRDESVVIQDDPLQRIDYYGYPYYRSNKIDSFQDAILVKDVGVSCNLLNNNAIDSDITISGVESYLVRQLKLEYNELSSITRKINAYTKDILNTLASRCRRKDEIVRKMHVASKHVMTSQYTNETGNPCLKLRFLNNTMRKYRASKTDVSKSFAEKEIVNEKIHGNGKTRKAHVEFDKVFAKELLELSPKYDDVLLRNYLITKREKASGNTSKMSLRKTENFTPSDGLCKDRGADKSRKSFYTSKCNPAMLTNWQEVSRRKSPLKLLASRNA